MERDANSAVPAKAITRMAYFTVYALCTKGLCGMKPDSCPRLFASLTCDSSRAPSRSRSSNSSRKVRAHHLGAVGRDRELHVVVGEGAEGVAEGVLTLERLREQVRRRAELEHDLRFADLPHQLLVPGGEDPVSDPVGAQGGGALADLADPVLAAFLADVDRHAEPGLARLLDERAQGAVGVRTVGIRAWAGDVDADDSARRVADRLLDDDRVLPLGECPVHHQDQAGAHLRVLEAGAVEPADRGHDDVVEVALAAAVPLPRGGAEVEGRGA